MPPLLSPENSISSPTRSALHARTHSLGSRAEWLLVAAALTTAAVWLWLCWCIFPLRSWNDIRLAPTFALRLGLPLYPGSDGPASTWMYGPLPVWLNWPATWAGGPGEALLVAAAINIGVAVTAIVIACLAWPVRTGPAVLPRSRLLAAAITIAIWPWANWQFLQADNFAVAFGLLSNLALVRDRGERGGWLAAVLATTGMMCKQTSLGVPLGQIAWLAITAGRRPALHHVARLSVTGCLWLAILLVMTDPAGAWFTAVLTPAGLPWATNPWNRFVHLLPYIAVHVALPVGAWLWLSRKQATADILLPMLVWLVAWVPGLASAFKAGGTLNCLQGFLLWLPPAAVVLIGSVSASSRASAVRGLVAVAAIAILAGRIVTRPTSLWTPHASLAAYDDALDLSRRLPGMVWLPWNPLVTIFSEGRLYHAEDGLYVRSLVGKAISDADARRHLPPQFAIIAVSNRGSTWGIAEKLLPGPLETIDLGSWTLLRAPTAPPISAEERPQ
jgi:hypothetical protein